MRPTLPGIFGHWMENDPARRQETLAHHMVEMSEHLSTGRETVETRIQSGLVFPPFAEFSGGDAVKGGRLMQPHEWICVVPVPASLVPPIHQYDARVRFTQKGIDKSHGRRPGSDDEIVCFAQLRLHREFPRASD